MIVPHRPRGRALLLLVSMLWMVSLWAVFELTYHHAVPGYRYALAQLDKAREDLAQAHARIERLRQRNSVVRRSDETSRAANQQLQETLAQRDEEVAALRADVEFYERLVGGSAQRQGLTVHSLDLAPMGDGSWRYTVTLTQNLKKASVSKGDVTLRVDGVREGKLSALDWKDLLQAPEAPPQGFSFKYFQQLEGSFMLPSGFTPHRVRVQLRSDGRQIEQVFPWKVGQPQGVS